MKNITWFKIGLIVIIAWVSQLTAKGQVTIIAQLDTNVVEIGDQVGLNIQIVASKPLNVEAILTDSLKTKTAFEVVNQEKAITTTNNNFLWSKKYTLQVWDSGYHVIPKLYINYKQNNQFYKDSTPALALTAHTPPIDTIPLRPIKPIIEEPLKLQDFLPYIYALGGLLLLGLIVWWYSRRQSVGEVPPPPIIIEPAHQIAFRKLEALRQAQLWQKGQIKDYQSQLTYIIREYLENRYKIPALESTTTDVLRHLKKDNLSPTWQQKLSDILQVADLVKFAKAKPAENFHEQVWQDAFQFVDTTKLIVSDIDDTTTE